MNAWRFGSPSAWLGLPCLAAALFWLGCNVLWSTDQLTYRNPDGGAGGVMSTGSGGSGGATTTTTTSTGGEGGATSCAGQVAFGLGETEECQNCVADQCCDEYLACAQESCDGLMNCAGDSNLCAASCLYQICDSNMAYPFALDCATCVGVNCCLVVKDCIAEQACLDCLAGNAQACQESTVADAYDSCTSANCTEACALQP
jgi:hypothetical protein